MKPSGKLQRVFALTLTAAILLAIYTKVDLGRLIGRFQQIRVGYLLLALSMFAPQIFVTSFRWRFMTREVCPMSLTEAMGMVMAGKALNALLPSKIGEMSKAYFLARKGGVEAHTGAFVVILEKVMDVLGLCTVFLISCIWLRAWTYEVVAGVAVAVGAFMTFSVIWFLPFHGVVRWLYARGTALATMGRFLSGWIDTRVLFPARALIPLMMISMVLWSLHVLQIFLFFPSLGHTVPAPVAWTYIPLSIFVGLLPVTIAGMGTRDAALIYLFSPYAQAPLMAAIGILCSMRYWFDTLLGVPFFPRYAAARRHPPKAAGVTNGIKERAG